MISVYKAPAGSASKSLFQERLFGTQDLTVDGPSVCLHQLPQARVGTLTTMIMCIFTSLDHDDKENSNRDDMIPWINSFVLNPELAFIMSYVLFLA